MKVKSGYLYHIKNEYFDIANDDNLMSNHEYNKKRPTYFTIEDGEILWFIPLSSQVEKYQKIIDKKIKKYGFCNTIYIRKILNKDSVILFQNAFPVIEKYIDHVHIVNGIPAKVNTELQKEILNNFTKLLAYKERGINLFFPDVDKLKEIMQRELEKEKNNANQ